MAMFLVFLKNTTDNGDFVAPVAATTHRDAIAAAAARYPSPLYQTLTCYEDSELRRILDDAQRWPGVASTVQPPLADLMRQKQGAQATMARLAETRGRAAAPAQAMAQTPASPAAAAVNRAPQDLKSALAALKQVGGLPVSGHVARTAEAPISRHPQPASAGPVITRHPEPEPVMAAPKSVIEVFRGLRR